MDKKFLLGMFSLAGMLLATSCSSEELIEQTSGDVATVSFAVNTEGASATRAISDGTGATQLYYAVYDANGKLLEEISQKNGVTGCSDLTTANGHKITLSLVKGQEYTVAFWAQNPTAPYNVDIADNNRFNINMNYGNANSQELNNNEKRDAFFGTEVFTVMGNAAKTVTLKRPFAQINVGTSDKLAAVNAGFDVDQMTSKVVIKQAATTLDVITGDVSGQADVTYTEAARPTEVLSVAQSDYTWLSMSYVLPSEKENSTTVSADFEFAAGGKTITLSDGLQNIPIQRNYRTNIIGNLLTKQVDFKVVVDKNFENPNHVVEVWDGLTTQQPALVGDTYQIENAAQWAWLGGRVISKNIKLINDIDFAGNDVARILPTGNCVLDGNDKTIRNAIYAPVSGMTNYQTGLLAFETGAQGVTYTIKNLTIENVKATNSVESQGYASALIADVQNDMTLNIDGVTVKNSILKGVQSVGSIVGFIAYGSTVNVSNTTVEGNNLSNFAVDGESGYVCGLVGKVAGTLVINNNVEVKNNTIDAFYATARGEVSINEVAAIRASGIISGTATTSSNTVAKTELSPLSSADLTIRTAQELVDFANAVNSSNNYAGKVIALANDIDLTGIDWTPIASTSNSTRFNGSTFDGRGHTIKNLTVNCASVAEGTAGFFGWLGVGAAVKNVNFKNASVIGSHYVGVICGYNQFGSVINCKVDNSSVNAKLVNSDLDGDKSGGAIGFVAPNSECVVKDITVANSTVKARRNAAQVIGYCYPNVNTISGLNAINVTVEYNLDALNGNNDDGKNGLNITNGLYNHN